MLSLLDNYLAGSFKVTEHVGPKTWVVEDAKNADKKFIVNQYLDKNDRAKEAFKVNKRLHELKKKGVEHFVVYDSFQTLGKYLFIKIEHCQKGDLNSFITENRYRNKDTSDDLFKGWILNILDAIDFLDQNGFIHKRLNTYNIFLTENQQLKIDGFEHVEDVSGRSRKTVKVNFKENYGMFNAPEIEKKGMINRKYHIWCLGWMVYEMATCEWQYFRLCNEKFDNWIAPNLHNSYSKLFNSLFKTMTKLSPVDRPSPQRLKKMTEKCFTTEIVVKKDNEKEKEEGNQYLYLLNLKYEDRFTEDDDVESLSDVGESDKDQLTPDDKELDVKERQELSLKPYPELDNYYTVKELIQRKKNFSDFLVKIKKTPRKRTLRRYDDHLATEHEIKDAKRLLDLSTENKNPYLGKLFNCVSNSSLGLCYVFEYFEEGNLDVVMKRMRIDSKNFSEDRVYDSIYYIVRALAYLHENKILHRDINPKNIYLRNSRMKLANIGLSKLVKEDIMKVKGKNVENPDEALYYSQDLLDRNGDSFEYLDDVWSVGCLLYDMYHLNSLYKRGDYGTDKFPKFPQEFDPSAKIKRLFNGCMEKQDKRMTSAQVLDLIDKQIAKEREIFKSLY